MVYYNDSDPDAAAVLRALVSEGLIAKGDVDERDIREVAADDVRGYTQCHWFAGVGGWPDDEPLWTGSPPCQPFSVAGRKEGFDDERDLWPHFHRLIDGCRPPVVAGEQVDAAIGQHWLDRALADLAASGYAGEAFVLPACAVNAPHIRERIFLAAMDDAYGQRHGDTSAEAAAYGEAADGQATDPGVWVTDGRGDARRVAPRVPLLADGFPPGTPGVRGYSSVRQAALKGYGNAVVVTLASEFLAAIMEVRGSHGRD